MRNLSQVDRSRRCFPRASVDLWITFWKSFELLRIAVEIVWMFAFRALPSRGVLGFEETLDWD